MTSFSNLIQAGIEMNNVLNFWVSKFCIQLQKAIKVMTILIMKTKQLLINSELKKESQFLPCIKYLNKISIYTSLFDLFSQQKGRS